MKTIDSVIRERLEGMKQWTFHYTYECPKCGAFYGKDDTYCTNDRTKIVKKETKYAETLQEPYNQAIDDTLTLLSHSLAEARREIDERCERAEKLLDDIVTMFGKQNSDLHIIQEVRDLMALRIKEGKSVTATWRRELVLLTGDNPSK